MAQELTLSFARDQSRTTSLAGRFAGFELPRSNTTYTPNQFFDVCLPHCSRGVVRLVGYMIFRTFGWCDQYGNPRDEHIEVSYWDLVNLAGISRGSLRTTIDEALAANLIRVVRCGSPSQAGKSATSNAFALKWSERKAYITQPELFDGFFAGDGNRTYIPNQFFCEILPKEPLTVLKVVGSVIRFSIGFASDRGHRRTEIALSHRDIQRYSKITSPGHLHDAIQASLIDGYIECVQEGLFDKNAGRESRKAVYRTRWRTNPKSVVDDDGFLTGPKRVATAVQNR